MEVRHSLVRQRSREAAELMQSLLDMEEHETKRLVRQVARMDDL